MFSHLKNKKKVNLEKMQRGVTRMVKDTGKHLIIAR